MFQLDREFGFSSLEINEREFVFNNNEGSDLTMFFIGQVCQEDDRSFLFLSDIQAASRLLHFHTSYLVEPRVPRLPVKRSRLVYENDQHPNIQTSMPRYVQVHIALQNLWTNSCTKILFLNHSQYWLTMWQPNKNYESTDRSQIPFKLCRDIPNVFLKTEHEWL